MPPTQNDAAEIDESKPQPLAQLVLLPRDCAVAPAKQCHVRQRSKGKSQMPSRLDLTFDL
jgi:hypothetical protein